MFGIFVNSDGCVPYADAIVSGAKIVETRNKDVLWRLDGERVAVIRTKRGKSPTIVGYVTIDGRWFCESKLFAQYYNAHLVQPGSKYDCHGKGKWFYWLSDPQKCEPYPLPKDAVYHGRSWCEF